MLIKYGCAILFVGINPGLESTQGYFGSARNQFFNLMNAAGMPFALDDQALFDQFDMGFINYCDRATKSEKDLTTEDMTAGKERLTALVLQYRPRLVCFVGKKCCKYQLYVPGRKNDVEFGLQQRTIDNVPVFCVPHGSTKGAHMRFEDKLEFYQQLADYHKVHL